MKKALSLALAVVMLLCCMSISAFSAGSPLSMNTGNVKLLTPEGNTPSPAIVYFGNTAFRVGKDMGDGILRMISAGFVAENEKYSAAGSNEYASSNLRSVVENSIALTEPEKGAIRQRTLEGSASSGWECDGVAGESVTAFLWAPTTKDAHTLSYCSSSDNWWLCSPGSTSGRASYANQYGPSSGGNPVSTAYGVRACFDLDLSSVVLAMPIAGEENACKLTVTDTTRQLEIYEPKLVNGKISFFFETNRFGSNEYLSYCILDEDGNVTAYENIKNLADEFDKFGDVEIDKPTITKGSKLYIISEQVNDGKLTNYASAPQQIELPFFDSIIFEKDYNDKYNAGSKITAVNETVSFTVAAVTEDAPGFADDGVFSIAVANGVGSAELMLPTEITRTGDFWYTVKESKGNTAGVAYDDTVYYLHLVTEWIDGCFGYISASVHTTENGAGTGDLKVTGAANAYGEGSLAVHQVTTRDGGPDPDVAFTAKVTFTVPEDTVPAGSITYGSQTLPWNNGKAVAEISLRDGDSVTFEHIPDGVTYEIVQTSTNADKGYEAAEYTIDEEDGDIATAEKITGTVSDANDTAVISNEKTSPSVDVGVILENGAFIVLGLGAVVLGAWLVIAKRKEHKYLEEE